MKDFVAGKWNSHIDVRDFIARNYTPYEGDESFLCPPTERTIGIWNKIKELLKRERDKGGVLNVDTHTISDIDAFKPGYIDKESEIIVGLQTDAPLKRAIMPFGGMRMVKNSLDEYGYEMDPDVEEVFKYRKTHNDGVFDVYTPAMRAARRSGIITGLPDAYGRGRIIGDYRRIALYGIDYLIEKKVKTKDNFDQPYMTEERIRWREEQAEQIRALEKIKRMAESYGFDISVPAKDTKEAFQWVYFGYLAAVKEQNGAAMSLGRVSTFLDIYAQRDLEEGRYTESQIQEIVDDFIIKLRIIRFLRTPAYNELFSGDPNWVTESIGGVSTDGRHMVTKMSYRFLHTLTNLGPAPEPNLTVLWSTHLPMNFKKYCAKMSIETCSIQYESDRLMRKKFGDDYGIACCVSAMRIGKQMQFFGARANLAKALLYAINGGRDEKSGLQIAPELLACRGTYLEYDDVMKKYDAILDWLAALYINTLNVIHYMHDKYCYEKIQMALHDNEIERTMACGIAGLSVAADSLSAIKYAKVKPVRNEEGLVIDYVVEGDFPKYGNNDERVDEIAVEIVQKFIEKLKKVPAYRNARHTMSILTITSNVVYGKKTGTTPDGRKAGEPFAPGANPMHGRDTNGAVASMLSVSKIPYELAEDGISYTFSIVPSALGGDESAREENLVSLLDNYILEDGHHINVNVLNRETLIDAMEHPENYPQLTIRVSGYAVNFIKLTREQQEEVIKRTFHEKI
ncbi:MAG: formate C-acetyltransferase [Clostridia bacterium]|nr:formate C-acetyltransferase [Clostridia bacterium]